MSDIIIDTEKFLSTWKDYEYLLEFMECKGNWNEPGLSDYPFYAYFSSLVNDTTILEIGTCNGGSATMMTHNRTNKVISYDIVKHNQVPSSELRGIEWRIGDFMQDDIDYSKIRLMSIDARHDGTSESAMFKHLEKVWDGGLLWLDDINLGPMRGFWDAIDRERHECHDLSHIGHGAGLGSGLVSFNKYYNLKIC